MKNTGIMCMISVHDPNSTSGVRFVDLGNYYIDKHGKKCVILTKEYANRYAHLLDVPVYVMNRRH